MDRRQKKTQTAIYKAVENLLKTKRYENITVQDIIGEANIGRSTFYAHFETKDELLHEMCKQIFEHIFDADLTGEKTHDFSVQKSLSAEITHLLYHIKEKKDIICRLLSSDSKEVFLRYFKVGLTELFSKYVEEGEDVPLEYRLNHLVSAYLEMVVWWAKGNMKTKPETMIFYYFSTNVIGEET